MTNHHLKPIVFIAALVLAVVAGSFYLIAKPPSPPPLPSVAVTPAANPAGASTPTIGWNLASITDSLFLGTVKSRTVTFTSETNLTNISIVVVPELAPYVSVSPDHLDNVAANTSTTLTLFFAATPNQPTGTFPGTIHITHRTATLAQPLPVSLTVAQDTTAPVLSILTPADNSTVSSSAIVVAGTVTDDTPVAVVVNDVSAEVNDNNFIANNVLLSPGSNTITVEATDVGGNTRRSEISIQVSNPVQNMEISAVPSSGLAPLAVTFSVSPFLAKPPVALMGIDFDGDGTIDFSSATSLAANHIYQSQGVYLTRVLLKDADGNSFSDEFAINVYPPPPFREIWAAMRSALLRKDTDTALFYFTDRSTPTYREVFEKLGTNLRTVAGGLPDPSQLQVVDVREGTARLTFPLTVQANGPEQEATFDLYFRRDDSRFWKIDKF